MQSPAFAERGGPAWAHTVAREEPLFAGAAGDRAELPRFRSPSPRANGCTADRKARIGPPCAHFPWKPGRRDPQRRSAMKRSSLALPLLAAGLGACVDTPTVPAVRAPVAAVHDVAPAFDLRQGLALAADDAGSRVIPTLSESHGIPATANAFGNLADAIRSGDDAEVAPRHSAGQPRPRSAGPLRARHRPGGGGGAAAGDHQRRAALPGRLTTREFPPGPRRSVFPPTNTRGPSPCVTVPCSRRWPPPP